MGRYVGSVLNFLCNVEGTNGLSYRYALIHAIRIRKLIIMGSRKKYIYMGLNEWAQNVKVFMSYQSHSPLQRTSLREPGGQFVVDAVH